ncbi:MAG: type II toxin-antitoxin system HigB family toxin [Chloroflexota bacterium]|nr:type II toxin-antitoxin system HigB family toxin [Chloroflexota bacterium]MDE2961449.1 type II toxin-antitoxin system HigB family toxin [Chloroflexota bacterium]
MWVVTKKTLREFWERYPDARRPLLDWYQAVERADWNAPHQVTARFANASVLRNNRVVFNIKGNTYRLVVHIRYQHHKVYIRFIGTHVEYDSINAEEV